jgi:hypothetical protein
MVISTAERGSEFQGWDSRRLWSLWEMLNFSLFSFVWALKGLSQEIAVAMSRAVADAHATLSDPDKERATANLTFVADTCNKMLLGSAINRLGRIFTDLRTRAVTYTELANELNILREAIEDDIQTEYFFHYSRQKGAALLRVPGDWAATIKSFKSVEPEITEAVDCYAMGHNTACVFHLMRVLEHGLRELAGAVNLAFGIQQWQTIIEQIEAEIREIAKNWKASPIKTDWMQFYSEAAKEFMYFKDGWRNHVMHNRITYDQYQAAGSIEHVRAFMNHLSTRLSE